MKKLVPPSVKVLDKYYGEGVQPLYTAKVNVIGGETANGRASGIAISDDGNLEVNLRLPEELGGPGGGTNPEQLFAAGYAACFHGALTLLASRTNVPIMEAYICAEVTFGRDPVDGLYYLAADVKVRLPGVEKAVAEALIRNAERICPYAKMAREGITSVITLV
jgi:lipoyl-dependent peroxiredoxin